jgi:hypothetical protein
MTAIEGFEKILNKIDRKEKKIPKELKQYYHTIANLKEDDYITFLDEASGEDIIIREVDFSVYI